VVQVRANDDGIVLQQLLYADEVRSMKDLDIEKVDVQKAELNLALQLISQIAAESYDPAAFVDEEKQRILGAIDQKIAGNEIAESAAPEAASGQIIDLMEALRASLGGKKAAAVAPRRRRPSTQPGRDRTEPAETKPARARSARRRPKRRPRPCVHEQGSSRRRMQTYSVRDLQSMLGISRAVIGSLIASGFVAPSRGRRNEYRFTVPGRVLLRTAYSLREAKIPARKILHSLRRLRAALPDEVPLTGCGSARSATRWRSRRAMPAVTSSPANCCSTSTCRRLPAASAFWSEASRSLKHERPAPRHVVPWHADSGRLVRARGPHRSERQGRRRSFDIGARSSCRPTMSTPTEPRRAAVRQRSQCRSDRAVSPGDRTLPG
jgi:hypothetical protein